MRWNLQRLLYAKSKGHWLRRHWRRSLGKMKKNMADGWNDKVQRWNKRRGYGGFACWSIRFLSSKRIENTKRNHKQLEEQARGTKKRYPKTRRSHWGFDCQSIELWTYCPWWDGAYFLRPVMVEKTKRIGCGCALWCYSRQGNPQIRGNERQCYRR